MGKRHDKHHPKKGLCTRCGKVGLTEIHHIYSGAYRARSDKHGFVIELCHECHRLMHETSEGKRLKKTRQRLWESVPGHTREQWLKMMGMSWLRDEVKQKDELKEIEETWK